MTKFEQINQEVIKQKAIEEEANKQKAIKDVRKEELRKMDFPFLSIQELTEILGLTIKSDEQNKLCTFLCQLSAYADDSQFNVSFVSPSSTGKSYIPNEISKLFPKEDVITTGYCSPTAFFHDYCNYTEETNEFTVDLERKILIFLDQPHTLLLQHLRPVLSHDQKEVKVKITDRAKRQLRTKNITVKGFPSVIFCTTMLKFDEQEATRFLILSPETSQEKIRESIIEKTKKESDAQNYNNWLEGDPKRKQLKERIEAIKENQIKEIRIPKSLADKINDVFLSKYKLLKPRHARDIGRLISLAKSIALLNLWQRKAGEGAVEVKEEDFASAFEIWEAIAESQELNLPPYVLEIYKKIVLSLLKNNGYITRQDVCREYFKIFGRPMSIDQLKKDILPMLERAGLIIQEEDREDKRRMLIRLLVVEKKNKNTD
jgi:hypothetical protein